MVEPSAAELAVILIRSTSYLPGQIQIGKIKMADPDATTLDDEADRPDASEVRCNDDWTFAETLTSGES